MKPPALNGEVTPPWAFMFLNVLFSAIVLHASSMAVYDGDDELETVYALVASALLTIVMLTFIVLQLYGIGDNFVGLVSLGVLFAWIATAGITTFKHPFQLAEPIGVYNRTMVFQNISFEQYNDIKLNFSNVQFNVSQIEIGAASKEIAQVYVFNPYINGFFGVWAAFAVSLAWYSVYLNAPDDIGTGLKGTKSLPFVMMLVSLIVVIDVTYNYKSMVKAKDQLTLMALALSSLSVATGLFLFIGWINLRQVWYKALAVLMFGAWLVCTPILTTEGLYNIYITNGYWGSWAALITSSFMIVDALQLQQVST